MALTAGGPEQNATLSCSDHTAVWSERDLLRRLARQKQQEHRDSDAVGAHAWRGAAAEEKPALRETKKKWVMQEHLRGTAVKF